jgi:phage terminase large subunit-like protein
VTARAELLEKYEHQRRLEIAKATGKPPWNPEPHQIRPGNPYLWLLLAGRGAGKTDACASYFDQFMRTHAGARGGIAAPTLGDALSACVYGDSGILVHNPRVRTRSRQGGIELEWPNGSAAALFGAHTHDDIDRFRARGGNRDLYWCEEIAAWRYLKEAWETMEPGLRRGLFPHIVGSTTPKTRPYLKHLMEDPETVVTRATIYDNPHLPVHQRERLVRRYKGTRWEAQELLGEYIEEVEGALWTYETLTNCRVEIGDVPDLVRVVVGVDPSGGDSEGNDEQGILVAGKGANGEAYVVADRSCKLSPDGWGRRVVQAYLDFNADRVLGETNYGGDMVVFTVKVAASAMGAEVATKKITASRGKHARAEPIAALYEQGRIHHVGQFEELEEQQRTWTQDSGWSPDRMDALVWALTDLMLDPSADQIPMRTHVAQGRIPTSADRFKTYG